MIDNIHQLKNLRSKMASGFLSLMVGSGFSKNVHPAFADWKEMLFDMTTKLYGFDINSSCPINLSDQEKEAWIREATLQRLSREGYLNVASAYIRLSGMEETVVGYIEARVPIIEEGGQYYLLVEGKKELLTQQQLRLHRKLVDLPWNNIYTTNYDPLLESCINVREFAELKDENIRLFEKSASIDSRLYDLQEERETFPSEQQLLRDKNQEKVQQGLPTDQETDKLLWDGITRCDNAMADLRAEKRDAEEMIRINENFMQHSYTLVRNASELSVKKNRNIIKLHGSLRSKEQRERHEFGFDGDPGKQYIISSEHYRNYPKKHEAFTQLMRISLLQESFCLIGFSGSDPNFLSWIEWVRDLLHRSPNSPGGQDYKIYLLELSETATSEDEHLFYENHRIVRVPLLSRDVLDFLESVTGQAIDKTQLFSSALQLFLQFLEDHPGIFSMPIRPVANHAENEWERLWKSVTGHGREWEHANTSNIELFGKLANLYPSLDFPQFKKTNYHYPLGFLIHLEPSAIDEMDKKKKGVVLRLALRVLQYYHVPVQFSIRAEVFQKLLNDPVTRNEAMQLQYRSNTLTHPFTAEESQGEIPLSPYEKIIRAAYSLQYGLLRRELDAWQPAVNELHLKAGFMSWFDNESAESILEGQLATTEGLTEQQRLQSMEMLSLIKKCRSWQIDKRLEKRIDQYEKAGYPSVIGNFEFFQKNLQPEPPKAEPYGIKRYLKYDEEEIIGGRRDVYARQYLSTLVETAIPARLFHVNVLPPEEWLRLFNKVYKDFPLPCIYYTLQYSDEDLLRRLAQEICFTDGLPHVLITERLTSAYWTIPEAQKDNLLLFLSEMMHATDPVSWQNNFLQIWQGIRGKRNITELLEKPVEAFVRSGLVNVEDEGIICEVIDDLLHLLPAMVNKVIAHLYYLNANIHFRQRIKLSGSPKLTATIEEIIQAIPLYPDDYLYLLGNLYYLLNEIQLQKISTVLHEMDLAKIKSSGIWRIMLHFIKMDDPLRETIKQLLLNHDTLWHTGIVRNGFHSHAGMLHLSELTRSERHPKGMDWSDGEVLELFQKMKPSLDDLVRTFEVEFSIADFNREWREIDWFLQFHKDVLSRLPDYQPIHETVTSHLERLHGYTSVKQGLYSNHTSYELDVLYELSGCIEDQQVDPSLISMQLNKLLMQAGSRVEEGLEYVSRWLRDKRNKALFEPFLPRLLDLLDQYLRNPPKNIDRAFVELHLVIIALSLKERRFIDQIINDWIQVAEKSRFNTTRQRLWLYHHKKEQEQELF
ncbi:MAG: SIR2 family protein [Bacteroidota bacterium]